MFLFKEANFPLKVIKGTVAPLGKGHSFCLRDVPNIGLQGWFEFVDDGQLHQLALTDISRFEISGGRIVVNPKKWAVPTVVAGLSLLTPLPVFLEVLAVAVASVSSGFAKTRIRFVCETIEGGYFTGVISSMGFVAVRALWQKRAGARVSPMPDTH